MLTSRALRALKTIAIFLAFALLINFAVGIFNFVNLFGVFKEHSGVKISQQEILDTYKSRRQQGGDDNSKDGRVVPMILHQVYHDWNNPNDDANSTSIALPDDWEEARQTCISHNPNWEYKLWSTKKSRDFIEDEFAWFLPTYDNYKYPIQRVDTIRYFALRHFGGIYIDLDNGCKQSLEPLTYYPAFTTDGGHGTLSNNILGGQPGHPFFYLLTDSLIPWNWNYFLPYLIVTYTSGQWYLTAMWEKYHSLLYADGTVRGFDSIGWAPIHHILMDMRPGAPDPYVFWTQVHGGSWDQWDSAWFGWIGNHVFLVISEVVGVVAFIGLVVWGCIWFFCNRKGQRSRANGYRKVDSHDEV